jgi:hypothetical protein
MLGLQGRPGGAGWVALRLIWGRQIGALAVDSGGGGWCSNDGSESRPILRLIAILSPAYLLHHQPPLPAP